MQTKTQGYLLWAAQIVLAALFLFAGGMKLVMPVEAMAGPIAFPGWFLRFIGVVEVLGALGLVLPAALRVQARLLPWAAIGLAVVMVGAVVVSAMSGPIAMAAIPLGVGVLLGVVAYGRRGLMFSAAR